MGSLLDRIKKGLQKVEAINSGIVAIRRAAKKKNT
jgi:hypothetical protein